MNSVNNSKVISLIGLLFVLSCVSTMISCSENNSQSATSENPIMGDVTEELGKCTDSREGKVEFYEADSSYYKCRKGKWLLTEVFESSSSEQDTLKSSSSSKEDDGDILVSSSSSNEEPSKEQMISKKISGVSQKGPFLTGTTVTLYEMDGTSFEQTKNSFFVKLENDKGEFEISAKDLSSQYVTIIADGFFNNEVSGNKSQSRIQLYAISDLTNRNTVNVNVLTHMEYERILYLVKKQGKSFEEAKIQAEKEVLSIFDIEAATNLSAEDLSIGGKTKDDAALLAVSILTLGTDMESSFSERISKIAFDIREDGVLNDEQIKTDIADGIALYDLATVRENIMNWKLFSSVADFETIVENYWANTYKLGLCSIERNMDMAKNINALSKNKGEFYVCENEKWRAASVVEASIGTCSEKNENAVAVLKSVNGLGLPMQCLSSGWEKITFKLYDELTIECKQDGEIKQGASGIIYACKNGKLAFPTLKDLVIMEDFSGNLWDGHGNEWKGPYEDYNNDGGWYWTTSGSQQHFYNESGKDFEFNWKSVLAENGVKLGYEMNESSDNPWVWVGPADQRLKDVSDWKGLCLVYASSTPFALSIHPMDNRVFDDDNYAIVPASLKMTTIDISWDKFHQPEWAENEKNVGDVVKQFDNFSFYFRKSLGSSDSGVFFIGAVGTLSGCSLGE